MIKNFCFVHLNLMLGWFCYAYGDAPVFYFSISGAIVHLQGKNLLSGVVGEEGGGRFPGWVQG